MAAETLREAVAAYLAKYDAYRADCLAHKIWRESDEIPWAALDALRALVVTEQPTPALADALREALILGDTLWHGGPLAGSGWASMSPGWRALSLRGWGLLAREATLSQPDLIYTTGGQAVDPDALTSLRGVRVEVAQQPAGATLVAHPDAHTALWMFREYRQRVGKTIHDLGGYRGLAEDLGPMGDHIESALSTIDRTTISDAVLGYIVALERIAALARNQPQYNRAALRQAIADVSVPAAEYAASRRGKA